ncbi:MFS transporter, DHA2 family, methylenomycin A resistance protein [Actinomadura madurae]|uniref:MFS transporter, DHA2 family, methylenomycin A resistance protein n=1 Tax=Actinomadura madurae TaxID=1993 RepID=A0A1I5JJL0_9ACTN|nr:MFS transporter [Actinomadura madurae]SFO72988.1 MFS transporter, DHA2 family, methylenomycin A resistance protein [Actinomadura madurae]
MGSTTHATAGPETRVPVPRRGAALAILCAGMFLVLLDVTIVNVALPGIGRALGTGLPGLQGVVDGYAVAIAGLLLGGGALGDRIGHRRTTFAGFALFGLASLACGAAPGAGPLIAARVAQGAGAALLLPGSLALVTAMYPGRAEQARALGAWAGISSTALPAGPLLGGLLADTAGWRWIFLLNVPITAMAIIGVSLLVRPPEGRDAGRRPDVPLDRAGLVLAPLTLGGLVWTVIAAGHGHPGTAAGTAVLTLAAGAAFVVAERRAAAPIVPGGLLRAPAFLGAGAIALIMNLVTNGVLFVATLWLQQDGHRSALTAGAMLLPMAAPLAFLAPVSGRLTARYGTRVPIAAGAAIAAAGCVSLLGAGPGGYAALLPALLGIGIGDGLIVTSVVAAAMRAAPPADAGLAGGFSNTARQIGTALGVAVYGTVAGPAPRPAFTSGLHTLAWASIALWLAALALTRVVPAR